MCKVLYLLQLYNRPLAYFKITLIAAVVITPLHQCIYFVISGSVMVHEGRRIARGTVGVVAPQKKKWQQKKREGER